MRYTCRVANGEPAPGDFSIGCFHDGLDTAVRHATEVNLTVPQEQMKTYASPAVGGGPINPKHLPPEILDLMGDPLRAVVNGAHPHPMACDVYTSTRGRWTCRTAGLRSRCEGCKLYDVEPRRPSRETPRKKGTPR